MSDISKLNEILQRQADEQRKSATEAAKLPLEDVMMPDIITRLASDILEYNHVFDNLRLGRYTVETQKVVFADLKRFRQHILLRLSDIVHS